MRAHPEPFANVALVCPVESAEQPHFTDKETKAWKTPVSCLGLAVSKGPAQDLNASVAYSLRTLYFILLSTPRSLGQKRAHRVRTTLTFSFYFFFFFACGHIKDHITSHRWQQ